LIVALAAGLLLGMASTLTLRRETNGSVTAVNSWRFAGRVPLIQHSVTHLREVKFEAMSTTSERGSNNTGLGAYKSPEHPVLIGDGQFAYPYREDASLIRGFLDNPRNAELVLTHPVDIRRTVGSWVLLAFVALGAVGWVWRLILGRDPLANAEDRVTPLPTAIGRLIFGAGVVVLVWFFFAGHHYFGPLATRKVHLLQESASHNDPAGIARSLHAGVFIDCRDDQGMTALMLAARSGAAEALQALLDAGANPNLRNSADETALLMAIHSAHPTLVSRLLQSAADVNVSDSNGRTALHAAAEHGDVPTMRLILKAGADVNQADNQGWTPLFFAAGSGHADALQALLEAGADAQRKLPDGRSVADVEKSVREASLSPSK
jgi:hypothetical protein